MKGDLDIMAKCDICGKGLQFGHNVSHSKVRTNRHWKANIQKTTVMVENRPVSLKVCTKCLRTMRKNS
jgi:large subunit ribosomal protein L28